MAVFKKLYYLPWCACALLTACAPFQERALPSQPSLIDNITRLQIDPATMPMAILRAHRFDPGDGLDMTEVAMLAVVNSPELRAARADAGITSAQAFAAGLLPDPQLGVGGDLSNSAAGAGATRAFNLGINFDITSLLTRTSTRATAREDQRKTDLALLWQEWQVVAQARSLFIKLVQSDKILVVLGQTEQLLAERNGRLQIALSRGLVTSDTTAPGLIALQDIQRQHHELERQRNQNRHDLNTLLGLRPELIVPLQGEPDLPEIDVAVLRASAADLPRRRPDLLGLQAGYRAQDLRYRAAILAQFPTLNVGLTRARDSSGIYSSGLGVTVSLPIFNRNRGNIAIEQATRQKLYGDYQQRLNAAHADIDRLLAEQRINADALNEITAGIAQLRDSAGKTDLAIGSALVDSLAYTTVHTTLLARQVERITLEQAILEQRAALMALVGGALPIRATTSKGPP